MPVAGQAGVFTLVTGSDGAYTFTDVPNGDYWIFETDPTGYDSTNDIDAPNDNTIGVAVNNFASLLR